MLIVGGPGSLVHGQKGSSLAEFRRHFKVLSRPAAETISQRNGRTTADEINLIL